MSTYTPSLGLELITPGSQAGLWGNTTNNSLNLIDQAITGVTPISFASASGSTYTLTDYNGAEDEARAAVLNITGSAIGANTVVIPNKQKTYLVRNNTGKDITFQTPIATTPCTVGAGYSLPIFCDGNNAVFLAILAPGTGTLTVTGGGTGVTTFGSGGFVKSSGGTAALSSSATVNLASEVAGALPVANGGTGATSLTSGALLVGNGSGNVASLVGGTAGYVATWNGSTWVSAPSASAGVSSVNGQTGAVTITAASIGALSTTGTAANSSQLGGVAASGYVTTTGTAANSSQLGGVAASGYVTTSTTQTISGTKTFNAATFTAATCNAWNFAAYTSWFLSASAPQIVAAINNTTSMIIQTGGAYNPTGVWGTISDIRKKENIEPARDYLSDLNKINIVKYSLISEASPVSTKLGVIAQELEQVFPGLVSTGVDEEGNEEKVVKMSVFIPMLIKAVQELTAKLDEANTRIAALEAK